MDKLLAAIIASAVAYLPDAFFKMSFGTEFIVSMVVGSVAYAVVLWYLRKLRGGY